MIDKNEAPDGYEAVSPKSANLCSGCVGENNGRLCSYLSAYVSSCHEINRKDKSHVIFIRKSSAPATLLHPMGSLGEEV